MTVLFAALTVLVRAAMALLAPVLLVLIAVIVADELWRGGDDE